MPLSLTTITVTGTYENLQGAPLGGSVTFTPTSTVIDSAAEVVIPRNPITATLSGGTFSVVLPATDNAGLSPPDWAWTVSVSVPGIAGTQSLFQVLLPSALGPSVDISALTPSPGVFPVAVSAFSTANTWAGPQSFAGSPPLKIPSGTAGEVLTSDSSGNITPQPPAVSAAALTAETSRAEAAEGTLAVGVGTNAAAITAEVARAEAAEALKAPLVSPALTGSPTATTASPLTGGTRIATAAYADAAVAVETSRAETAESANATAITTETSRAETAEGLLAPKASPALTGTPTGPTAAPLTGGTQLATAGYADSAVAVETSRAQTAEASALAAAIAASLPTLAVAQNIVASGTLALNTHHEVSAASGSNTQTLPASVSGALIVVEKTDAAANPAGSGRNVSVTGNIRGAAATITLELKNESEIFLGYAGSWWPIGGHKTLSSLQALFVQTGPAPSGDPTGATDSVNLMEAAASAGSQAVINLAAGQYYVNQSVLCTNLTGVVFKGQGKYGQTRVTPVGTGMFGVSVFKFVNCWSCGVENMWIDGTGNTTWTPLAGVEAQANNPGGSNGKSFNLIVKDCVIGGTSSDSMTYGIAWTLVSDENNDEGLVENTDMINIASSCVYIGHLNSLQHKFIGGQWYGSSGCSMITLAGGSFSCLGTNFLGPGWVVTFGAGTYTHPSLLCGVQTEGTPQWFQSNSGAAVDLYVSSSYMDGGIVNGTVIDWEGPGLLSVSASLLKTGQSGTLAKFTNAASNAVFSGCSLGISGYTWQNNLSFQTCSHISGAVTLTQLSGANPVYQPNDTGASFTPMITAAAVSAALTTETLRAEAAEAALASGAGVSAAYANNASGGTSGTTVTVANSGTGGSGNAFHTVSASGITFDNTQAAAPSALSYKVVNSNSANSMSWLWPSSIAAGTTIYLRAYVRFSGALFATGGLIEDPGGDHRVNCDGTHWTAQAKTGALVAGTTTPAPDTWYRVETQFVYGTTGGATVVRIYNYANVLLETITATGGTNASAATLNFGSPQSNTTGTMWMANLALSTATWVGPAFTTDQNAADIQPVGPVAVSGTTGIPADAGHVHPLVPVAASTPALTSGTAAQLSTTQDVTLYINVVTTSTLAVALGPTSTPANTIFASGTAAAPMLVTVRVPASWYISVTFTSGDVTFTLVSR